jgi:hypothetical protein
LGGHVKEHSRTLAQASATKPSVVGARLCASRAAAAARELWDRGWGKAAEFASIEDGNRLGEDAIDREIQAIADQLARERLARSGS